MSLKDILRKDSISVMLISIFILLIVFRAIMLAITKEPISIQFWALFIAVATTKGMIFDGKGFGLLGKAITLGIVWLAASNFI